MLFFFLGEGKLIKEGNYFCLFQYFLFDFWIFCVIIKVELRFGAFISSYIVRCLSIVKEYVYISDWVGESAMDVQSVCLKIVEIISLYMIYELPGRRLAALLFCEMK